MHRGLLQRLGFALLAGRKIPGWQFPLRVLQVAFALLVIVLNPPIQWLKRLLTRLWAHAPLLVRYLIEIASALLNAYMGALRRLPPVWATVSIALPLAILEPAKLFATILIAERPRTGIALWLALQALSFVLIDKTWVAVRPQSRKLTLVSRLHAFGYLHLQYGKRLVVQSGFVQAVLRLQRSAVASARAFWRALVVS